MLIYASIFYWYVFLDLVVLATNRSSNIDRLPTFDAIPFRYFLLNLKLE